MTAPVETGVKTKVVVPVQTVAAPPASHGQGQTGITEVATAVVTKGTPIIDQVPAAIPTHAGLGTVPPEKIGGFDRTVATPYGK